MSVCGDANFQENISQNKLVAQKSFKSYDQPAFWRPEALHYLMGLGPNPKNPPE